MRTVSLTTTTISARSLRLVNALEVGGFFLLLLIYIWFFAARAKPTVLVLVAFLVASHVLHDETPRELGVRWKGFVACARRFTLPVLAIAGAGVCAGVVLHTVRPVPVWRAGEVLIGYVWWALLQQYLLNGFFTNRLAAAFDDRHQYLVAPLAGMLFAGAHAPNIFLMEVTLVSGALAAWVYRRYRNLLFLAVAHAVIGTMIWFAVSDSVSHHLRVGPGM
jgi:hypothetical protein